jgi:hypothetical protein
MTEMTERGTGGVAVGTARRFFLVERYVPSMSAAEVDAATARLDAMADGRTRHLGTLLIPDEETCLSLFEAPERVAVETANGRAGFALHRIVEVVVFAAATDASGSAHATEAASPARDALATRR